MGGLLFDKDAMYIDIPDWKVRNRYTAAGAALKWNPRRTCSDIALDFALLAWHCAAAAHQTQANVCVHLTIKHLVVT